MRNRSARAVGSFPSMVKSSHLRRLFALSLLLGLVLAGLGARLVVLQVWHHEKYRRIAEFNTQRFFLREPRRGDILDANGNPLATSVPVKKVFANPVLLGPHYAEVARMLAPLLSYEEAELIRVLRPVILRTNEHGVPVTNGWANLKRKVNVQQWQQITQAMAGLTLHVDETSLPRVQRNFDRALRRHAIYAEDDQQRIYPSKNLAAHVVGFAQEKETEFNNISLTELEGRDGIELWLDRKLRGACGWRVTETDNRRREIVVNREQEVEARAGLTAVLTLDVVIQNIIETELAEVMKKHTPLSASAMVVRPRTGEVLAMATLPDYDLNAPGKASLDARRNRNIADVMEPGSTFKIVVVSAALNDGLIGLNDTFDCERGNWRFMGRVLHDHDGGYGILTVENIITKSSNIGAAKIAVYKLGEQKLYDYIRAYGFGSRTGITLGAEENGIVRPVNKWDKVMISRIPMGQSIAVTHLQIVMAMCAIANDGRLMRPMLISRLQDQSGQIFAEYHPQMVRQVISSRAARQTVAALKTVVSKDGTAAKAALEHFTAAGKTGTAQKVVNGIYPPGKYISSFIGFFPADAPELCISVVLDEPQKGYYGGQTAAPSFKNIAEQAASYLKIRPDREEMSGDPLTGIAKPERLNTASLRAE